MHIVLMTRVFIALLMLHSALWFFSTIAKAQEDAWSKMPITATYHSAVEVTPWGIAAGSKEGFFESQDRGLTWRSAGLQNRWVTDIKSYEEKIYASTYYWLQNQVGLFMSNDKGVNWIHIGSNFSTSNVDRDSQAIYLGGYSHGLWVSHDDGTTWQQKIGDGEWFGPEIKEIESIEEVTFASTGNTIYKTTDHGETWVEVVSLRNKGILYISAEGSNVIASSNSSNGATYLSKDFGETWNQILSLGTTRVSQTFIKGNIIFAGAEKPVGTYTVIYSPNLGTTWVNTGLKLPSYAACKSITHLYSDPNLLFTAIAPSGFYKFEVPDISEQNPFLRAPWQVSTNSDLIRKVYSYFDHEYPLLSYSQYPEPQAHSSSTLNYLGLRGIEPDMYYSSHDGIDFALPYGTPITAPASGTAVYYYCPDCGHTIKINHHNGYTTTYMHLQINGLITTNINGVEVQEGDVIGKVGLTGRTTGPHLHFAVTNSNGYPDGRTDPFGWEAGNLLDPWENLAWDDASGYHRGSKSINLWINLQPKASSYTVKELSQIALENMLVQVQPLDNEKGFTTTIRPHFIPILSTIQDNLEYIESTSFILNAFDHSGKPINEFTKPISILLSLTENDITNALVDTIKLYIWNETQKVWEPLPTVVNWDQKYLIAETTHFSRFAAFAEKISNTPPKTTLVITGQQDTDGSYLNYPTISFTTDSQSKTYFSLQENGWVEYQSPFILENTGTTEINFKSVSSYGIWEDTQTVGVKIKPDTNTNKKVRISDSVFSVNFQ